MLLIAIDLLIDFKGPTRLRFKALNFFSATLDWMAPCDNRDRVNSYTVNVRNGNISYNTTVVNTTLNVTGLTRGVEYTVTVYSNGGMGRSTINMTLDGMYKKIIMSHYVFTTKY